MKQTQGISDNHIMRSMILTSSSMPKHNTTTITECNTISAIHPNECTSYEVKYEQLQRHNTLLKNIYGSQIHEAPMIFAPNLAGKTQ